MLCIVRPIWKYITLPSFLAMDDRHAYEKFSIRDSARSSKKYGSTSSRSNTRAETYIKHLVSKTDTLQGIALKYGVTMEQIRRANRLFASDSLFLRENLLIPSTDPSPTEAQAATTSSQADPSAGNSRVTSPNYDDEDANEFLVKIDAAIASTKAVVKKIHKHSEFADVGVHSERRKPVSRMRQMVNNNGTCDFLKMPQTTVVTAQGNLITTSMQRYQQQQDELFEL